MHRDVKVMMTKTDFKKLAEFIARYRGYVYDDTLRWMALDLVAICRSTNPRFNEGMFMRACRIGEKDGGEG